MDYGLQSPGFRIPRKKIPRVQIPQAKFFRIPDYILKQRTNYITPSVQRILIIKILTCSGIVSGIPCEHIENEFVLKFARKTR